MALAFQHGDSIREYLTGAVSDGGAQDLPRLSIGNFRSSSEAASLAIHLANALDGVVIQYASGANPVGIGVLLASGPNQLQWQTGLDTFPGPAEVFPFGSSSVRILEASNPNRFLRVLGTPPFNADAALVSLTILLGNVFGFDIVPDASATAGTTQYRATVIRNETQADVSLFKRWILELAASVVSNQGQLGASGSGTLKTSGDFSNWPTTGWCRVETSGGTLREVVYYSSRTQYTLTVPVTGRARLGTVAAAGASNDVLRSVPGLAIGFDAAGVQSFGTGITVIANDTAAPAGVTWSTEVSKGTGLSLPRIAPNKQIGFWMKREILVGAIYSPNVYNELQTDFIAF